MFNDAFPIQFVMEIAIPSITSNKGFTCVIHLLMQSFNNSSAAKGILEIDWVVCHMVSKEIKVLLLFVSGQINEIYFVEG